MVLGVLTVEQQVRVLRSYVFVVLRHYAIEHCPQFYRIDEVATDDVSFATGDEYCSDEQWKRVFAKAIQNDDMHIAKVVHALWYGSILNHNAPPAPADYQMPPSINWLLLAQNTVECINMSSYEDEDEQFMAGKRGWSRGKIGFSQYWKQSGEAL
ncbi:hypothetical protein EC988_009819 [Linderina pennispora]|nr:hypothetical protein EC988_009819 [Linderina pennispora]